MGAFSVASGDATIAAEAFGDADGEPILLIQGVMGSMLWWQDEFCRRLAAEGHQVIRYDNRDTGISTSYPPGSATYGLPDMVGDVLAILDHVGAERGHVVGISMGGIIAQLFALIHPDRVASLTILSSTPISGGRDDLPPPTPGYLAHLDSAANPDFGDREALVEVLIRDSRALGGSGREFDEDAVRKFVERDVARTRSPASLANHNQLTEGDKDGSTAPDLGAIKARTVVIHGTQDPLFPLPHGESIAAQIPGARLVALEGAGHETHEQDWPVIIGAVHDLAS